MKDFFGSFFCYNAVVTTSTKLRFALPYILIVTSMIGMLASVILIYDQVQIWQNPSYVAPCSLNPVLSCGSVINSKQGHILGIPAPFFGLVMFPALYTFGIVVASGVKLKKWLWLGLQAAVTGGVAFALWLFWISLYKIHGLCPYCLLTDAAVYTMAWYVTLYNIEQGYLFTAKKITPVTSFVRKHHLDILISVFLFIAAFILHHFWYYYGRHI